MTLVNATHCRRRRNDRCILLAAAFNVGSLPPIVHFDCEVSTNVVLASSLKMSEML
jgi:hypothetical protein